MKCAIITPIGPGHEALYALCRASVEQAFGQEPGPFQTLEFIALDDTEGRHGRSARRNDGIDAARALGCEWIFFLDADDVMAGGAFGHLTPHLAERDALWGLICENPFGTDQVAVRLGQLAEADRLGQILANDPFMTLQMGHFVRTELAAQVRFDTAMNTGEDFRYYLQVWQRGRCRKIPEVLFVNRQGRHSHGPRSADGTAWKAAVRQVIQDFVRESGYVSEVRCGDVTASFQLDDPFDLIQRHYLHGRFFEEEELAVLREEVAPGGAILDVGANLGNHLIYLAKALRPRRLLPMEPGERAQRLLRRNIALNGVDGVDEALIGLGAGQRFGQFSLEVRDRHNLGASCLREDRKGPVKVYPLDVKVREPVDFLKIDVEGMELEVLRGARKLVAECRPQIFIEVANANIAAFRGWAAQAGYTVRRQWGYVNAVNYLMAPA